MEAFTQLQAMEEQNVKHLGLTSGELKQVVMCGMEALEKNSVAARIDEAIVKVKNMPPRKSIDVVLSVCKDILCGSLHEFSTDDKDILLGALAQYTVMERHYQQQDKMAAKRKPREKQMER
jgi:hypothetical protein